MADTATPADDIAVIERLLMQHFEGMAWGTDRQADWDRFEADFLADARLFPAARPASGKSVDAFVDRMKGVAEAGLHTFEEHTRKVSVSCFGNVAVAMALSWMLENGEEENRDISAYLLVKTEGQWKIAAHAWHPLSEGEEPPETLR